MGVVKVGVQCEFHLTYTMSLALLIVTAKTCISCFLFSVSVSFTGNALTSCQKQLQEAINLPPEPKRVVPHCKLNGDNEEIQCENSSGLCWCIDKDGRKLSSTATNQAIQCSAIGKKSDFLVSELTF